MIGFTILMKESDGFYYYADEDGLGGLIVTNILAGTPDPSSYGLEPGYAVSSEVYERQKEFYNLKILFLEYVNQKKIGQQITKRKH